MIAAKLQYLYPNAKIGADRNSDVILAHDGLGVVIEYWNTLKLGPQPSIATIEAVKDKDAEDFAKDKKADAALSPKDLAIIEWVADLQGLAPQAAVDAVKAILKMK